MKIYSNIYANQICEILIPLVGKMMACGIVKSQAKRLGVTEESINKEHLSLLSEGITKGLVVFVGSDVARQVSNTILSIR